MDEKFENLEGVIEGILFVSGDGIQLDIISEKLNLNIEAIKKAVKNLEEKYSGSCGIKLVRFNNKIQFSSNPDYADLITDVLNVIREKNLSKATMETMAIIAYKQPVTRLEIEEVRGVNSDYAVQVLMENKLIDVIGRKDTPGKPLLFGTTEEFLKRFNLKELKELPNQEDLLERIKLIHEEASNSLYRDFKLSDQSEDEEQTENSDNTLNKNNEVMSDNEIAETLKEEIPDFLKDENFQVIN